MSISPEAVDAAAKAIYESESYQNKWDWPMAEIDREEYRKHARAALEAAAPHMLAGAWDEAIQDADDEGYLYTHQSDYMKKRNPYRPNR